MGVRQNSGLKEKLKKKGYTFVNELKIQISITFNSKEYDNKVK